LSWPLSYDHHSYDHHYILNPAIVLNMISHDKLLDKEPEKGLAAIVNRPFRKIMCIKK